MNKTNLKKIEGMIYVIRKQKVMLDSDLAELYGVETKALKRAVKRNIKRFPPDFMFELTKQEFEVWRYQFGTSKREIKGLRICPFVFTENGVAMLSGILNSDQAIEVNIMIMRIFTMMRHTLRTDPDLTVKVERLEKDTDRMFQIVFKKLEVIEDIVTPRLLTSRKKIGLKN